MSGSTIGGIAGGIIGFFVGGPAGAQWGFMIGSAVGAIVDPEKIEGPRLKDASNQTANDGIPRAYGYGRFPCTGNVIWRDVVKEVKNTEGGKGGPEVTTYTYTRSYAIAACKGPISGFLIIKRNGKIVYDTRPDSELTALGYTSDQISETRAAQAKFMEVCTFYYGDQTSPDPTMVAVKGAGNVPNYTGTAYIVLTDDETREGEIAQYEFVVADCGERDESHDESTSPVLVTGSFSPGADRFARDAELNPLAFEAIPAASGADIENTGTAAYGGGYWSVLADGEGRYSADGMETWQSISYAGDPPINHFFGNNEFIASRGNVYRASLPPTEYEFVGLDSVLHIGFANGWYYYHRASALCRTKDFIDIETLYYSPASPPEAYMYYFQWIGFGGAVYATRYQYSNSTLRRYQIVRSISGLFNDVEILHDNGPGQGGFLYWMEIVNGEVVVFESPNSIRRSGDGFATAIPTPVGGSISQAPLAQPPRRMSSDGTRLYLIGSTGSDVAYTDDLETFTVVNTGQSNTHTIVAGVEESNLVPIPDAPGFYINPETGQIVGPSGTQIDSCTPTLGSIVADQCAKRNVTTVDVSELTDPVTGYRVASVTSPQQNIAGLMPAFFFDSSQFDGTIHFPKRGGEPTFHIPYSELVERTDGTGIPLQWVRKQEPELLRKQTVGYIDPATTFTATTQQWERRAGTVKAQGESTLEIPVVGQADWAAQVAEKSGKVAWAESTEGSFHLTRAWAKLVTAAVGTIEDVDGTIHVIRIERIQDDGGIRMLDVRKTRASAYESSAEGAQKPLPLFPGSNIRGPTLHAVMNMPAAADQFDRPGLTWTAAGMTDGWVGARLQVQRSGEWVTLGDVTTPGSVGTLVSDLPAHSGDIDTANVLRIRMDDTLSSVTFTQLLSERNPVAILREDHTVEIVQFQDVVQDSDGVWECTTLIRGNLDTDTSGHEAGATVVLLEGGVQFVDLRPDDAGKTLLFRVVSLGTDPDAAEPFEITFEYVWSSTEWPVAYLDVEKDGDDFILTWLERRRLGTDVDPIRSVNWDGYSVSYEHSGGSGSVTVTNPTHTFTLPGATDVDFTVAQLNRLTGRGPEITVNHE